MGSELNVGSLVVGAGSAGNKLAVHQTDAGANSYVHITHADTGLAVSDGLSVGLDDTGSNAVVRLREAGTLKLFTSNAERLSISSEGDVEVNNAAATAKLLVMGTGAQTADILLGGSTHTNAAVGIRHGSTGVGIGSLSFLTSATDGALSTRLAISSAGLATFSAGIAFQSATTGTGTSSEAFTLDKYETGLWTPVIAGGSCTNLVGKYTRVGNEVTVTVSVMNGALSGITGTLNVITGLPFTVGSTRSMTSSIGFINLLPTANPIGVVIENSDRIDFLYNNAAASWSGANFSNSTGANLHFSATYFV